MPRYVLLTEEVCGYLERRWDELSVDVHCFSILNQAKIRTIGHALRLNLLRLSLQDRKRFDAMLFAPQNLGRFGFIPEDKPILLAELRIKKEQRRAERMQIILHLSMPSDPIAVEFLQ